MVLALCLLGIPCEFDDLLLVLCYKVAAQDRFAGWVIIMNAMAGGAQLFL